MTLRDGAAWALFAIALCLALFSRCGGAPIVVIGVTVTAPVQTDTGGTVDQATIAAMLESLHKGTP